MRRKTSAGRRRTHLPAVVVAALVLAGSCGGGGGGSSLADLAEGNWSCTWRETSAVDLGGSGAGQDVKVTAKITPDDDSHGKFQLKLVEGSQDVALAGTWRLSGSDLTVAITEDSFAPAGGTIVYRGVTPRARTIEVKDPPTPVDVSHRGGTYEFRWGSPDDIQDQLTCHR